MAKQNVELQQWNTRLKQRVLDQTAQIRAKSDAVAQSHQLLRRSFKETIEALSGLIEIRDRRTSGHSHNVTKLVIAMTAELQLDEAEAEKIRSAALLHYPERTALDSALQDLFPLWGKMLDSSLRTVLEAVASTVFHHLDMSAETIQLNVKLRDLKPGMQLLRDLYSGSGVMLLNKGAVFDETAIALVRRRYQIDPFDKDIPVQIASK